MTLAASPLFCSESARTMADIIPPLADALKALQEVRRHPEVSTQDKLIATELTEKLHGRIELYKVEPPATHIIHELQVQQHATEIRQAVKTYDFGTAVSHGMALMDALPGPGQSGRKWPRPR